MKASEIHRLCVIDTETGGLNAETDPTIEVAVALYDIEHAAVIAAFASLIRGSSNGAKEVNRIPVDLLQHGFGSVDVWDQVQELALQSDVIVAHRAEFDRRFVPSEIRDMRPWACSKFDMDWPKGKPERGEHLVHLALAHDVPVYSAHRAWTDVDTLVRTFQAAQRMGCDVREMVARSMRPKGLFEAIVSYEKKDAAKNAGFRWEPENKRWTKSLFLDEVAGLPFKTRLLDNTIKV